MENVDIQRMMYYTKTIHTDGMWKENGGYIMNTEKITLNISAIDLAKVDLLVENGFAANRSELLKNAITQYLNSQDTDIKHLIEVVKGETTKNLGKWYFGIQYLNKKTVDQYIMENKSVVLVGYGMLIIDKDVTLEDLKKCVRSIKTYGVLKASKDIKKYYMEN